MSAKSISTKINRITGIPKDAIVIAIHELPAENYATSGEILLGNYI
jgi:phenylpyruvate tautomerase PptA (4-oxalocrotonate tautomerase family)